MKMYRLLILILLINFYGCSFTSWVNYTDTTDSSEWNSKPGFEIGRGSDIDQPIWTYQLNDISIKVSSFPVTRYTLTFGPPYLPVIPFYQFQLLFGLFSSEEESWRMTLSIKSTGENSYINLSEVSTVMKNNENNSLVVLTDIDTTSILNWKVMDFSSKDSSSCKVKLSSKSFSFQLGLPKMIENEDSVVIKINGVHTNDKKVEFPELIITKKNKFHFQDFQFGV